MFPIFKVTCTISFFILEIKAPSSFPLFDSTIKFSSGSGWPSFTQPIKENAIKYEKDVSYGMVRVEVMCNTCDAHLGHIFPDGPEPSGLRYCINSESMTLDKETA